jgi:hypothetical protein
MADQSVLRQLLPDSRVEARVDAAILAAEAFTMPEVGSAATLAQALNHLRAGRSVEILLCALGHSVFNFASAASPHLGSRRIFAQRFVREPFGRGAHFDVLKDLGKEIT